MKVELWALLNGYYDNSLEIEEIAARLDILAHKTQHEALLAAASGYYDESLEVDEVIGEMHRVVHSTDPIIHPLTRY
jgi:hypothetical protein